MAVHNMTILQFYSGFSVFEVEDSDPAIYIANFKLDFEISPGDTIIMTSDGSDQIPGDIKTKGQIMSPYGSQTWYTTKTSGGTYYTGANAQLPDGWHISESGIIYASGISTTGSNFSFSSMFFNFSMCTVTDSSGTLYAMGGVGSSAHGNSPFQFDKGGDGSVSVESSTQSPGIITGGGWNAWRVYWPNFPCTIKVIDNGGNYDNNYITLLKASEITSFSFIVTYEENNNPYATGSDGMGKGGEGGRGKWNDSATSDSIPGLEIANTGMTTLYTPTTLQIKSLSQYLWSDLFSLDTFKKLLSDPFQALISLHAVPIATESTSVQEVTVGNIGTGVNMNVLAKQWYKISMGSVDVNEYYGSFFDYSPYTKFQIWLPYIGYQSFNPDDFVGGTCTLEYVVDALTGACSARLISSKVNNSVLYQYSGSMAYQIPMTKNDWASTISSVFNAATSIAGMVGGISGASGVAGKVGAALSGGSATMNSVVNSAPTIARSGSIGGASGWAAQQTPYIIRVRPRAIVPKNQQRFTGFPSYKTKVLSTCKGYTEVEDIRLEGLSATDSEKSEIVSLLKTGVIL